MARLGLGEHWRCAFANDISAKKCKSYRENWEDHHLVEGDVAQIDPRILRQPIDLYWASSPCQDFSIAGKGAGINGSRSGVFVDWAKLVSKNAKQGYKPRIIAFENVVGLITRNEGRDFLYVIETLASFGYRVGALEIDASHFLPQSRPRLFVIAVRDDINISSVSTCQSTTSMFSSIRIKTFTHKNWPKIQKYWTWWKLPQPTTITSSLNDLIDLSDEHTWFSEDIVASLLAMMSPSNRAKITARINESTNSIGMLYKRGRPDSNGTMRQRAEIRFDGYAGCLRTPGGGSSRQTVVRVGNGGVRARLLSPRESAKLMGLPDTFILPKKPNEAYHLTGDGVVVPIVAHLERHLFRPLMSAVSLKVAA